MEGDPAIRWQTMRDLLDAPENEWRAERQLTMEYGWGARLLAFKGDDGRWGGGFYSPKWTSSTYTLLSLCNIGIPGDCEPARNGTELTLLGILGIQPDETFRARVAACDRCIVG